MERATLGGSNCPCQEDYGQGHCWCYAVISHDPVLSTLEAPYYENLFEVVPIDGEYFIENVIITRFEQTTSNLPNWKLQNPTCPYATLTKYSGAEAPYDHPIGGHHYYKPNTRKDQPRSLKALSITTLFKVFPYVEDIHENFSLNQDEPLGIAKYVYYITTYHNAKPPFIENKTKVTFLVELNTELLMTKYEKDLVKSLIFKKHPDSGQPIVMKSDRVLSLPYDLLQYRHPPFLRSSPLADRRLKRLPPGQQYSTMNTWMEDQCMYALTLEKGSHNLIPFNTTYRTVLPRLYLNRLVHYNWEVYVKDSLANDHNICKNVTECFESYLRITKPTLDL